MSNPDKYDLEGHEAENWHGDDAFKEAETDKFFIKYDATKSLKEFHRSEAVFRGIMGPFGSGKSVACCIEMFRKACQQKPDQFGVRNTRFVAVRNTYSQLWSTTIQTWQQWFPSDVCPIVNDSPVRGVLKVALGDGTTLRMQIWFMALDRPEHVDKITSLEITGFYLNEARRIPLSILNALMGRIGRFPAKREGGCTWAGGIADTNPPDIRHWWYDSAEKNKNPKWGFFRQPSALIKQGNIYLPNPEAENISNLPGGYMYYYNQLTNADPEHIKVHIMGEYGSSFEGKPVYEQSWRDSSHMALDPLPILDNTPVHVGMDFGLTPAAVCGQFSTVGRMLVQREFTSDNMGMRQFMEQVLIPGLAKCYPGRARSQFYLWGDPAGDARSQADSEFTAFKVIREYGFNVQAAGSNDFKPRKEAVESMLLRMVDGLPSLQVDKSCEILRDGFNGGYSYRKTATTSSVGTAIYVDKPEKNEYSHIHDAMQYMCLGMSAGKEERRVEAPPILDFSRAMY